MFGKKAVSPEEKLLRIIEQPKAKAASGITLKKGASPAALGKLTENILRLNFLDLTNRFLIGAAVISTGFFVFVLLRPSPLMRMPLSGRSAKIDIQKPSEVSLLSRDEYLQAIISRNMFDVIGTDGASAISHQRVEQLGLKLVGIITIDKDSFQALIEDKDGRTHLGSPNETILGSITIEAIEADKVVLRKGGETLELK
ncbi:MAG: type II secretion system protein N [Candidatus Omnitrophota bacterium]|jgi:type II secretory pathway component PulC